MSGMRPPVVAGVGGGVGTTTVAVALRGRDAERGDAAAADILVCRGTLDSLRRAAALLDRAAPGPRPVLAVSLDGARVPRGPVRARLELLEPAAAAMVLLPHVRSWHTVADPLPEVARLLVDPPERVPRPVRAYAAALRELAAAVAASGRLHTAPAAPARAPRSDRPYDASQQGGESGVVAGGPITACPDGRPAVPGGAGGSGAAGVAPGARGWGPAAPRIVGAFRPAEPPHEARWPSGRSTAPPRGYLWRSPGPAEPAGSGPVRRVGVRVVAPTPRPAPVRPHAADRPLRAAADPAAERTGQAG